MVCPNVTVMHQCPDGQRCMHAPVPVSETPAGAHCRLQPAHAPAASSRRVPSAAMQLHRQVLEMPQEPLHRRTGPCRTVQIIAPATHYQHVAWLDDGRTRMNKNAVCLCLCPGRQYQASHAHASMDCTGVHMKHVGSPLGTGVHMKHVGSPLAAWRVADAAGLALDLKPAGV
eukprot:1158431-Pelagomonas_calceolata.AAC.4